jgi:two-component system cell cycle response regulator
MGARILIIEDNPANLELMSYLLRAYGHRVRSAMDGESGLEAVRREVPELIVCDLQLPRLDGYGVLARLRQHPAFGCIPIVAVTAFAMVGDREKVLAAGFDGYITKPISPETFVPQVESFLSPAERAQPRPAAPAAAEEPPPPALPRRATLLVVDDSPVNVALVRSTLEPFGYEIVAARSKAEALDLARRRRPDLILSDVHMPQGDGYELIRAVKADSLLRDVPFVFISSTIWPQQDLREGLGLGAAEFILRPIEPGALLARIEACLPLGGDEDALSPPDEDEGD